jgi:hypothetical protein
MDSDVWIGEPVIPNAAFRRKVVLWPVELTDELGEAVNPIGPNPCKLVQWRQAAAVANIVAAGSP